jgi:hypothetical protein
VGRSAADDGRGGLRGSVAVAAADADGKQASSLLRVELARAALLRTVLQLQGKEERAAAGEASDGGASARGADGVEIDKSQQDREACSAIPSIVKDAAQNP